MSVDSTSPTIRTRILSLWREKPLRPELLADEFIKQYPHVSINKRQIADVIRKSKDFASFSDETSRKRVHDRFGEFEQKRGGLVFVDSAHLRRHYVGGPYFVVLATDAYSKATYVEAVKRLTGASVARAFEKIILRFYQGPIKLVLSDYGSEYISAEFKTLCRSYGIEHKTTTPSFANKSWSAERRIRELRRVLARLRSSGAGHNLVQLLKEAENYFNRVLRNSITGLTADETTNDKAPIVLEKLLAHRAKIATHLSKERRLRIGDRVLLRLPIGVFDKTDDPKFGTEVYTIVGVKRTSPRLSYRLRDEEGDTLVGSFPASRLVLVDGSFAQQQHQESLVLFTDKSADSIPVPVYSPPVTRSKALFSRISQQ